MTASVFIACLALLFTVGSFYWLQARKGRLKLYPVVTFSGYMDAARMVLRLPVIIFNSGARPRVVTALRLAALDDAGARLVLECQSFRKTISPEAGDREDSAHAYAIAGRQVVTKHAQFNVERLPLFDTRAPVIFDVEALLDHSIEWSRLGRVVVHTEIIWTPEFIGYSNNPGIWPLGLLAKAERYRGQLHGRQSAPVDAHGNDVH
ncbi:hypothetical protein [Arthrobacter sp. I3]|uniref:hypothetical protein n=1 Tax=Arthrobacter sp. I3 TaxID=218158 RepID=UPI0012EBAF73|nr:hypothetical protein [Arthrobacter sp. I3]